MVPLIYPRHKNWDIPSARKKQAENIQVIADELQEIHP